MSEYPDNLVIVQRQLTLLILGVIALVLIVQLCAFFADILRIVGISILFSYLFINVVDWLNEYLPSRVMAVLLVYTVVLAGTIFGALIFVPAVMVQVSQLLTTTYEQLPQLTAHLTAAVTPIEQRLHAAQIELRAIDIMNGFFASIPKIEAGTLFTRVGDVAVSTMTMVLYGLSIFVISFYFLLDGYQIQASVIKLFPRRHGAMLQRLAYEIDKSLQAFFQGQIVLGLGFGAFMILIFLGLGVHYALLLGVILGIWEIIPVIGPTIGFFPVLIAVGIHGMDNLPVNRFSQFLIVLTVFYIFQWLKDNILAPRYIGNVIGLHPVTIFIAIMIGAKLDGMLGVIFALPAACVVNVMYSQLHNQPSANSDESFA